MYLHCAAGASRGAPLLLAVLDSLRCLIQSHLRFFFFVTQGRLLFSALAPGGASLWTTDIVCIYVIRQVQAGTGHTGRLAFTRDQFRLQCQLNSLVRQRNCQES